MSLEIAAPISVGGGGGGSFQVSTVTAANRNVPPTPGDIPSDPPLTVFPANITVIRGVSNGIEQHWITGNANDIAIAFEKWPHAAIFPTNVARAGFIEGENIAEFISGQQVGSQFRIVAQTLTKVQTPYESIIEGDALPFNATFVSSWDTSNVSDGSSASNQVHLPLVAGGTYSFRVDWGDGSPVQDITAWDQPETTHTYAVEDEYDISIEGQLDGFSFNNGGDRNKLVRIGLADSLGLGDTQAGHFYGCRNLTNLPADMPLTARLATTEVSARAATTTLENSFRECWALVSMPAIDTSTVSNFSHAWDQCLTLPEFPALDFSAATDITSAWINCQSLLSFPLVVFPPAVTDYASVWESCSQLLEFPAIDVSAGTSFVATWRLCSALTAFPLLDFSNAETVGWAWRDCKTLTAFPLIDLSSCTNAVRAWQDCHQLLTFPLLTTTGGITNFGYSWQDCGKLAEMPSLDFSGGVDFQNTWQNCTSLTTFPFDVDISNGASFSSCWDGCTGMTSFPILAFDEAEDFNVAWQGCTSLTTFPLITAPKVRFVSFTWNQCTSMVSFPPIDFALVQDFSHAWRNCIVLSSFPDVNTSSGTDFNSTWRGCTELIQMPRLDFVAATNMTSTWRDCDALVGFEIGQWSDMANVTNFDLCFNGTDLPTFTYNRVLDELNAVNSNTNVLFDGGASSQFNFGPPDGIAAHNSLVAKGWTMTDGGVDLVPVGNFASRWDTKETSTGSTASDMVKLPLLSPQDGGQYNFTVNWGDGTDVETILNWDDPAVTHEYAVEGVYDIHIDGQCEGFRFNNTGDRLKLIAIGTASDLVIGGMGAEFYGCENLGFVSPELTLTGSTTMMDQWRDCKSLVSFPVIDTSQITLMVRTWMGCENLAVMPMLDSSASTGFLGAWDGCRSLVSFPALDMSGGANFRETWRGCSELSTFPLVVFGGGASFFRQAWANCSKLATIPLLAFNSITEYEGTFGSCTSLREFAVGQGLLMGSGTNFISFLASDTMSVEGYSRLLEELEISNQNSVGAFNGGESQYNASGGVARAALEAGPRSWAFSDGGPAA